MIPKEELPPWKRDEEIDVVVAHWCNFAPGRSGMYETVKELIMEEMHIPGVLPGLINPDDEHGGKTDGYLTTNSHGWAWENATVHCSHYFMTGYACLQRPRVFFMHGTPEACYEAESTGGAFTACLQGLQNYEAAICLSRRHYALWKEFDQRGTLNVVDKGIDLQRYTPKGAYIDLDGEPKIGVGEVMRGGGVKGPIMPYWAASIYHRQNPKMRLHHWGVDAEMKLIEAAVHKSGWDRFLGKHGVRGTQLYPENWYRGCYPGMMLSSVIFGEPSRVQFEAQACGTPVIAWGSNPFGDSFANAFAKPFDPKDMAECIARLYDQIRADPAKIRKETRMIAEQHFDIKRMAVQVVDVLRRVQNESPA